MGNRKRCATCSEFVLTYPALENEVKKGVKHICQKCAQKKYSVREENHPDENDWGGD